MAQPPRTVKGSRPPDTGRRWNTWLTWPIRHPYWTVLLCLATTGLLAIPASQVRSDNSSEIFELEDDPDRLFFDEYKEQLGASDFIVVTVTCDELFTHENLRVVQYLTDWLAELPQVEDVTGLEDVEDIKGSDEGFIVEPFFEEVPTDPEALRALRQRALDKPLYLRPCLHYKATDHLTLDAGSPATRRPPWAASTPTTSSTCLPPSPSDRRLPRHAGRGPAPSPLPGWTA
jgi:hypothetical protein